MEFNLVLVSGVGVDFKLYSMLSWISRCWGGMGVKSQFERARIRSVIADWQVPDDSDVCVLINSFKGTNPQIQPETALNMFLSHLEMSEEKGNALFLLKHLYILDHTVEEGVALQYISTYYSSEFFIFRHGSSIEFNPLKELVATYFLYIKKKAEAYWLFEPKYYAIKKSERLAIISNLAFADILVLIDQCLDVQKAIDQINLKYKSHNKQLGLIQMIFTMLLKSYLFCYTLVSACAKVLFCRLRKLSKPQVVKFYKFIRFYNKEYTRSLYDFIESNKEIYEFKNMKYSEIILIDKCYIEYLENYLRNLENQPLALEGPDVINFDEQNQIEPLPSDVNPELLEIMVVSYHHKKKFNLKPADQDLEALFYQYPNLYSDAYESESEVSKRRDYNERKASDPFTDIGGSTVSSMRCLTESRKVEFGSRGSSFNKQVWNVWENTYSS